jgi:general secretion pathway protein C
LIFGNNQVMSYLAFSIPRSRIAALVLSAACVCSVAYWLVNLQLQSSPMLPSITVSGLGDPVDSNAVASALGAGSLPDETSHMAVPPFFTSRLVLQGVVGNSLSASALIAVDGMSPKPVRLGGKVVDGWTLQAISGRMARLKNGSDVLDLVLPALPLVTAVNNANSNAVYTRPESEAEAIAAANLTRKSNVPPRGDDSLVGTEILSRR